MPETKQVPSGPLNEEEAAALHACFAAHVTEVRHFIDEHNLRMASPQGEFGPSEHRHSLHEALPLGAYCILSSGRKYNGNYPLVR